MNKQVLFSDPIPSALAHYQQEFVETLASVDVEATLAPWSRPVEGLPGWRGKMRMHYNGAGNLVRASRTAAPLVQLWPTYGLLEARLWASGKHARYVMLHDPEPLRRQGGYSRLAGHWASGASIKRRPTIVVQSMPALEIVRRLFPSHPVKHVLHPILSAQSCGIKTAEPSVVVAGQFKPTRDVNLLREIGPVLQDLGWQTRIVGRGWPPIIGWDLEDRFVSEGEMDQLLTEAWAFLLPYRTYFQSNVAVRALERGTVTVGEASPFLQDLFGGDQPWLVQPGAASPSYVEALEGVRRSSPATAAHYTSYRERARRDWSELFGEAGLGL